MGEEGPASPKSRDERTDVMARSLEETLVGAKLFLWRDKRVRHVSRWSL